MQRQPTVREIARIAGRTIGLSIDQMCRGYGRISQAHIATAHVARYEYGHTHEHIAAAFDRDRSTIAKWLLRPADPELYATIKSKIENLK